MMQLKIHRALMLGLALLSSSVPVEAGSIFLTGHDPDFHANQGGNTTGARHLNQVAITFITDSAFNPFTLGGVNKFLFVESSISPPGGHIDGINGIINSGYVSGTDFERHGASDLNAELNLLGTKYNAIVVASTFGGILTQAELNILNARSADIIGFLNSGGGIYAMAESHGGANLAPSGGYYGYLPFIVSSASLDQSESGFTVTPFGASLGLLASDINGNASHNIFTGTGGLNIVDQDASGNIMSLAGRGTVTVTGIVPSPTAAAFGIGGLSLLALRRRQ